MSDTGLSGTVCPTCGAPAERGQLVCLECGSRIALSYRRPPSWKIPVAITAVLLVLAGAGAVLAYQTIDDEAEREVAATPAKPSDDAEKKPTATTEKAATEEDKPEPADALASDGLVKDGALYTWPARLNAFTVVLLSAEDGPSARTFAESAAETVKEKIGVIRSNEFETLPKGFFIVFAGSYPNRADADEAAARLGGRFDGAFPQRVRK